MRLHVQGRVQTGIDMFDSSLGAMTIWQDAPGGPVLLLNSAKHGGLSAWRFNAAGHLGLQDMIGFSNTALNAARDHLVFAEFQGDMIAFFGIGATTFWGYVIHPDGTFGARRLIGFDRVEQEILAGHDGLLQLWGMLRDTPPDGFADSPGWGGTSGISTAQDGTVLLISPFDNALHVLPASGQAQVAGASLGLANPTGMAVFSDAGFGARVVIAGAGGSSLSVLRKGAGGYDVTDHVLDTASTAFYRVQAISGSQVQGARGPLDLVLVGGADHGVSLFALTQQGHLVWLDTFFSTAATGLYNVATLEAVVIGDRLMIAATSGREPGITLLSSPLSQIGGLVYDGQGGPEDDIIIARQGVTQLSGGGGANVFVIRPQDKIITISDFTPGLDRLDLSAWPMLRHISQLQITQNNGGVRITFRGYELHLTMPTGASWGVDDIFPNGLDGPDRVMVLSLAQLSGAMTLASPADLPQPDPTPDPMPQPAPDAPHDPSSEPVEQPAPEPEPEPDHAPQPTPDPADTGAALIVLRDAFGAPVPDALISFTLDSGAAMHVYANSVGMAPLPDLPVAQLDVIRPWSTTTGDPMVTARDALDVLRLAVGLSPSFGPASAQNFIAADINRDGQVTALDALEVLRAAVGLPSAAAPRWVFLDADQPLDHINASNVSYQTGMTVPTNNTEADLELTGILLGYMILPT